MTTTASTYIWKPLNRKIAHCRTRFLTRSQRSRFSIYVDDSRKKERKWAKWRRNKNKKTKYGRWMSVEKMTYDTLHCGIVPNPANEWFGRVKLFQLKNNRENLNADHVEMLLFILVLLLSFIGSSELNKYWVSPEKCSPREREFTSRPLNRKSHKNKW